MRNILLTIVFICYFLTWLLIPRIIPEEYFEIGYIMLCAAFCAIITPIIPKKDLWRGEATKNIPVSVKSVRVYTYIFIVISVVIIILGTYVWTWSLAFEAFEAFLLLVLTAIGFGMTIKKLNCTRTRAEQRKLDFDSSVGWYGAIMDLLFLQWMLFGAFDQHLSFRVIVIITSFSVSTCYLYYRLVIDKTAKELFTMWGVCILTAINLFFIINPLTFYYTEPEWHQYLVLQTGRRPWRSSIIQLDNGEEASGFFIYGEPGDVGEIGLYEGWFGVDFLLE